MCHALAACMLANYHTLHSMRDMHAACRWKVAACTFEMQLQRQGDDCSACKLDAAGQRTSITQPGKSWSTEMT
jgi:hypothetical protein